MAPQLAVSAAPLYQQVRDLIETRIARGDWQPGELLPSEPKLAEELNVSPGTVRKALDDLSAVRLVVRRQGRGTFVAAQTPDSALFHFFRIVGPDGERVSPTHRELERGRGAATAEERRRLALGSGARVLRIKRLRGAGDATVLIERITLPGARFPGLGDDIDELPNTLYDLYQRRYGITIRRAVETLRAVAASEEDAALLDIAPATPLLEIDRLAYSFDDTPVEWRRSWVNTAAHAYRTEVE